MRELHQPVGEHQLFGKGDGEQSVEEEGELAVGALQCFQTGAAQPVDLSLIHI